MNDPAATTEAWTRARAAMASGRADQALALLEPICNAGIATARDWQLLGFALREAQRMPEAIAAFERAEQLDRDAASTATALAQTRIQCGQPAIEACQRALSLAPQDDSLLLGLSAAHVAAGQRTEAEALLAAAVARRPDWLQGQCSLAEIRWTGGDRQGFARGYAEACVQLPSALPLRMAWFQLVALTRDWPAARAIIDEGERIHGPKRSYVVARAFIAAESGAIIARSTSRTTRPRRRYWPTSTARRWPNPGHCASPQAAGGSPGTAM
jgi:tetratricopeptide (TPR) repeat protein